ncbi:MAG: hypothetical protein OXF54_14490 [Caldilineaceae bacterium]|nr:hypothetical protein [Caldilineaceae bacterium]
MSQQQVPNESPSYPSEQTDTHSDSTSVPDSRTPFFKASNAERYQRKDIISQIQNRTESRLICFVAGSRPECMINQSDTIPFVDLLHNVEDGENIDLLLHTIGGSVDAAEKIILFVRSRVGDGQLRVIVPESAKSAGTLMVLGADSVVMSDTSELGPIDPQMPFPDSRGNIRWHSVQNYLDAYEEHYNKISEEPNNVAAQIMLGKIDPETVTLCRAAIDRARQSAESLLKLGMFRDGGNFTLTVNELLDTARWLSHSQMISWQDAKDARIGLKIEYLEQDDDLWQAYWRLYCLQRLAIADNQKLYESDRVSLTIDAC